MSVFRNARWYRSLLSLRWRLALVYSLLFCFFVILLSIFLYNSVSTLLLHSARDAFPPRARALRTLLIQEVCTRSGPQNLHNFLRENLPSDVDTVYLLDKNGTVIASNDNSLLKQPFPAFTPAFFAHALDNVSQTFENSAVNRTSGDGLLLSLSAPADCQAPQKLPAYMALLTTYSSEEHTLSTILLLLDLSSAFMIVIGALIIAFFTGILFKPLHLVTSATRALAAGDLQQRVPPLHSQDEISELATSFNQMAERIEQTFAAQQASEKRARRFVSDASHELRTPITSLRGFTDVLLRGAKDDPATMQHILELMKTEAERMTTLVNQLLTLARLDEGHIPTIQVLDLVAMTVAALQQARKQAPETCKIALELATSDRLHIQANGDQIAQLLLVLLDNAVKYGCTGDDKHVRVLLTKTDRHARIQVIDHGNGIGFDDLPHIFDRFYRGENALNGPGTPIPGTGLGLSIALAIAHTYEGTLTVCSQPQQGTTFTVTLPCLE